MTTPREFAAEMEGAPDLLERDVRGVVSKGALNIKEDLRAKMAASGSFGQIDYKINYDLRSVSAFGGGVVEAEIGPSSGRGDPGALANIAYFGTSRGGGTVEDPRGALDREEPKFTSALEKLLGNVL